MKYIHVDFTFVTNKKFEDEKNKAKVLPNGNVTIITNFWTRRTW